MQQSRRRQLCGLQTPSLKQRGARRPVRGEVRLHRVGALSHACCADGRARPDKDPIQVMQQLSAATVCHTVVRVAYTISLSGHLRSRRIQQNLLQHLNMPQGCNRRDTPAETTASQIGVFVRRVRKGRSLCDVHNAIYVYIYIYICHIYVAVHIYRYRGRERDV